MAKTYPAITPAVQMKSAIRDLWLDVLVSDQYEQTQSVLSDGTGYCCLGVLCDVHANVAPKNVAKGWEGDSVFSSYDGEQEMLSLRIGRWAFPELKAMDQGVSTWNVKTQKRDRNFPETASGRAELLLYRLAEMNDDGASFQKIAKYIEANTVGV